MGTNRNSIIDINGKRYDAITGSYLGKSDIATATSGHSAKPAHSNLHGSIDGFNSAHSRRPSLKTRKQEAFSSIVTDLTKVTPVKKSIHAPAAHAKAHQPQKGKTLMRTAVRKPEIVAPSRLKAMTRTDILARVPQQQVAPKLSHNQIDPKRLKKANQMAQSPAVSHYAATSSAAALAAPAPYTSHMAADMYSQSTQSTQTRQQQTSHIPLSTPKHAVRQPDMFDKALASATSHEQTFDDRKLNRKKNRMMSAITLTMGLLLITGVIAYFNAPALSMRLASSRAGFSAKLPGYSPVGFGFGNLSYGPGNITVSYTAEDNEDKNFEITQRSSDWDSQALLTNFVASANKAYQTYERAGRTIYFYGNNTATWVDSGVWYTVNGNNSLSKNQLLDMAGSL